jgi:putative transposase
MTMPSRHLPIVGGVVYHVTNRAREGLTLFESRRAYRAFVDLIDEAQTARPVRVLALCVMPNHWHFVLWPETDGQVEGFVGWLSLTHAKRLHRWRGSTGTGPVYPRRFRASPIESGRGLYRVIRYVERNPCAAGLASTPSAWPWSSASPACSIRVAAWPVPQPPDWASYLSQPVESDELRDIRRALKLEPLRRRPASSASFDW